MYKEDLELIKYFDWVGWQAKIDPRLKLIHHIANERKVSFKWGQILKQKGVRAGVPDVNVAIPSHGFPGMWIELKIPPNTLSSAQEDFCKLLHGVGYVVRVATSADEMIALTKEYLWPTTSKSRSTLTS